MNKDLEDILVHLKGKRGLDFTGHRPAIIERWVTERVTARGCSHPREYLYYLERQGDELDQLIRVLTISTSCFFREPLTFEYIAQRVLPEIISRKTKSGNPLTPVVGTAKPQYLPGFFPDDR